MFLSCIIPMYNCEPYIGRCLDSVLGQGLDSADFEVIVVDDGSRDKGIEVVKRYQEVHPNIKLITQHNAGVGAARNRGLAAASGDYVHFVDADDTLAEGAWLHLKGIITECVADIVFFNFKEVVESDPSIRLDDYAHDVYYKGDLRGYCNAYGFQPLIWSSITRRKVLNGLKFKSYLIAEDLDFMLGVYAQESLRAVGTHAVAYCYLQRQSSATHRRDGEYIYKVCAGYGHIYSRIADGALSGYSKNEVNRLVLTHIQCAVMTKIMSSAYSRANIKDIFEMLTEKGVFPFKSNATKIVALLSRLSRSATTTWMMSFPYRHIYLKRLKAEKR